MTDETVEQTSLADILSKGREEAEAKPEPKAEKEAPAKEATKEVKTDDDKAKETKEEKPEGEDKEKSEKQRDDKGRFVPKEEADNLKRAMKEERRQRQDLERKLRETSEKSKEKTDFWTDPDKAVEERLAKERAELDQRFFKISERYAKRAHDDYDEVVGALLEDAEEDPDIARSLFPQVSANDDPAEFLYQQARNHKELKSFDGDLGKYREHVESQLKKDLDASNKRIEELESQLKNLGKVKPSLNDEQSTAGKQVSEEAANEPTPMAEILKPRKRRA